MGWDIGFENICHEKLHFIGSANKDLFRVGWGSLSFRVGSGDEWHSTYPPFSCLEQLTTAAMSGQRLSQFALINAIILKRFIQTGSLQGGCLLPKHESF